jgi:hypothetical protein
VDPREGCRMKAAAPSPAPEPDINRTTGRNERGRRARVQREGRSTMFLIPVSLTVAWMPLAGFLHCQNVTLPPEQLSPSAK